MLYVSTRNTVETYTATRTLTDDFASDGGGFLPFRMPEYSAEDQEHFRNIGFFATVSEILGAFFRARMTPEDVRLAFGENLSDGCAIDRKALLLQLWTPTSTDYSKTRYTLYLQLCRDVVPLEHTPAWVNIAIDIACIFGLYCSSEYYGREVDFAVCSGDFSMPMAVYYAHKMGLPAGRIVCITNENGALWDFFTHGTLNCGASTVHTFLPALDIACPREMERLLMDSIGCTEAVAFADSLASRRQYACGLPQEIIDRFYISVAGTGRIASQIVKIHKTSHYVLDPVTALCLGGLQDYRANSGESRETILISRESPICHRAFVSKTLRVAEYMLAELI